MNSDNPRQPFSPTQFLIFFQLLKFAQTLQKTVSTPFLERHCTVPRKLPLFFTIPDGRSIMQLHHFTLSSADAILIWWMNEEREEVREAESIMQNQSGRTLEKGFNLERQCASFWIDNPHLISHAAKKHSNYLSNSPSSALSLAVLNNPSLQRTANRL